MPGLALCLVSSVGILLLIWLKPGWLQQKQCMYMLAVFWHLMALYEGCMINSWSLLIVKTTDNNHVSKLFNLNTLLIANIQ